MIAHKPQTPIPCTDGKRDICEQFRFVNHVEAVSKLAGADDARLSGAGIPTRMASSLRKWSRRSDLYRISLLKTWDSELALRSEVIGKPTVRASHENVNGNNVGGMCKCENNQQPIANNQWIMVLIIFTIPQFP